MKANVQTETAVMQVVDNFAKACAKKDLHAILALFTPDADVVCFGTSDDEKCIGMSEIRDHFERNFNDYNDLSLEWSWYSVSTLDSLAWISAEGFLRAKVDDRQIDMPLRLTAVLEMYEHKWSFVQMHFSTPKTSQVKGQFFPVSAAAAISPN